MPRTSSPKATISKSTIISKHSIPSLQNNTINTYKPLTIMESVQQGFGYGTGFALANRIIGSSSSYNSINYNSNKSSDCEFLKKEYEQCQKNDCIPEAIQFYEKEYDKCLDRRK